MIKTLDRKGLTVNIFKYIKSIGYTPTDISIGDCYFISDMGDCGNVHFHIKELPGWKFAMWIGQHEDESRGDRNRVVLQFFTQHKDNIDKFKPSRSKYKIDFTYEDIFTQEREYRYYEIKWLLDHIKHNKAVAYVNDATYDEYCSENYYKQYIRFKLSHYKYKLKDTWKDIYPLYNKFKIPLMEKYPVVNRVEIKDNNTDGFICSPRWDMYIYFNKIYDDEDKQQDAETELLYKFFKKNFWMYDNINIQCHREADNIRWYSYDLYDKKTGKRIS